MYRCSIGYRERNNYPTSSSLSSSSFCNIFISITDPSSSLEITLMLFAKASKSEILLSTNNSKVMLSSFFSIFRIFPLRLLYKTLENLLTSLNIIGSPTLYVFIPPFYWFISICHLQISIYIINPIWAIIIKA